LDCLTISVSALPQIDRGWYVLWAPTGFGGSSVRWVEVECALKEVDEEGRVWYPLYAQTTNGKTSMYPFYPNYMFIYCQWGNSVENVVLASVPITVLFLKDEDINRPHRLSEEEILDVRAEVERQLSVMGTQASPLGFNIGDMARVVRGLYVGRTGKILAFDHGRVVIELIMFNREMGIPFDAKDLQIL